MPAKPSMRPGIRNLPVQSMTRAPFGMETAMREPTSVMRPSRTMMMASGRALAVSVLEALGLAASLSFGRQAENARFPPSMAAGYAGLLIAAEHEGLLAAVFAGVVDLRSAERRVGTER